MKGKQEIGEERDKQVRRNVGKNVVEEEDKMKWGWRGGDGREGKGKSMEEKERGWK